ncbi:glycosyltransferase [Microbacterium sp.]|uniref:glycosyltransferase n=1 Tax=Microbacterium sp. TaxID=51671 RepID=UPI002899EA2F|nr:glycosyltransferase [Microbacterium sp.]
MRILVHLNSLELGGTQINAVDFAVASREHGVTSVLVGDRAGLPGSPNLLDYAAERGVSVRAYEPAPGMRGHSAQLSAFVEELGIDLIHVYGMWGAARPVYWGPARWGRTPWVQTVYEMSVAPVVLRHMPLIVGTGYLLEEQADRPGGTVLISPPVDLVRDAPASPGVPDLRAMAALGGGPLVVIVSRLDSRMKARSIGIAIEAMRTVGESGATLVVVGAGDAEADLRARARDVNGSLGRDAVRMLGAMSDPRAAYAAADVVLGMGGSAARALAFGKPLVVQGEAGWSRVFDRASADGLARSSYWSPDEVADPVGDLAVSVAALLADPARRADLGRFGREFAITRFGLPAMAERLCDVYRGAMSSYAAGAWLADLPREGRRLAEKVGRAVARPEPTGVQAA